MPVLNLAREGLALVVDDYGPAVAPTLLMLHAGGETRAVWRPVAEALDSSGWRRVALDLRGHGDSGRSPGYFFNDFVYDVLHVIAQLQGAPLVLAGGSIGGVLSLIIAGEKLARIDGLALLDVPTRPRPEVAAQEQRKIAVAKARGMSAVATLDDNFIHSGFVADVMRDAERWNGAARAVRMPVLHIRGARSSAIPDADVAGVHEDIPHARFATVEKAGHLVARDQPLAVAELLAAFLASLS